MFLLQIVIFVHRWLGLALCLLFALWFSSGIVMMYWGFPEISGDERLARAEALKPEMVRVPPSGAWSQPAQPPDSARLTMLDGRPVYRFRSGRSRRMVYADTGEILSALSPDMALRIAAAWTGLPARDTKLEATLLDADQWTVSGEYRALRPLLKFSWPSGDEAYVSAQTAEVVQHTTSGSRLAAYFGAIPHWLYWTPLRKNARAWNRVVVWSSGIGAGVSFLGLIVGVSMYALRKRVPYQGQKRWHMIFGLSFGVFACTWALSGLISMEPFVWLAGGNETAINVESALRGGVLDLGAFDVKPPRDAIQAAGAAVKELELAVFADQPCYIAHESARSSRVIPIRGASVSEFDHARILDLVSQAVQPDRIAESRVITGYDAYYLDRHHQHPLPALFVRLADTRGSMFYIDPKTAHIVEAYDSRSRWNRWLYHGLHSWNLPWLYRNRPAWDIMVMALLAGGTALSVTAVILGLQLLGRKLRIYRAPI